MLSPSVGDEAGVMSGLVAKRWTWNAVLPAPTFGDAENITVSLEFFDSRISQQGLHLCNGCLVKYCQPSWLIDALAYQFGVQAFEIGEHDQLFNGRVIAHVASFLGVLFSPLLGCVAVERHVENVGFVGVDLAGLCCAQVLGDQVLGDCVGVYPVVDFAQATGEVPFQTAALDFFVFEPLKFLDQEELEFCRYPGGKFKGDVFMSIGAAVAANGAAYADGGCQLNPFIRREGEAVEARFGS